GQLEQVVVNGFELVRQGVYAGDRQAEVGVELVGDAERVRLDAEPQELAVAVKPAGRITDLELAEVLGGERNLAEAFGLQPDQARNPGGSGGTDRFHPHRLVEERTGQDQPWLECVLLHGGRLPPYTGYGRKGLFYKHLPQTPPS